MGQERSSLILSHDAEELIILGRIGAPFGVKGWVHVHSFTENGDHLFNYPVWFLRVANPTPLWQAYELIDWKAHGKGYTAKLSTCHDRDQAQQLTNLDIGIPKSLLPKLPANEHYWTDLIGLLVLTETGEILGRVTRLFATGANDVLVVENEKREHLLPYVPGEYILSIDLKKQEMRVRWDPEF